MAKNVNVTIHRGEKVTFNCVLDPVVSIAGWTIVFNWAKEKNSKTKIIDDKAMTIDNAAASTFHVSLSTTETDVPPAIYYFDVWRTNSGNETPLIYGKFTVLGNAKKPEL